MPQGKILCVYRDVKIWHVKFLGDFATRTFPTRVRALKAAKDLALSFSPGYCSEIRVHDGDGLWRVEWMGEKYEN